MKPRKTRFLCLFSALLTSVSVQAANVTWSGADATWADPDADSFDAPYVAGDNVTFGDTGVGAVTVSSGVAPGTVTFNHASGIYVFSGSAWNAGSNDLSITGGGTVQLGNMTNAPFIPVWGNTLISGGSTLSYTRGATIGSSGSTVTINNGTLRYGGDNSTTYTSNNPISIGVGGGTISSLVTGNQTRFNLSGNVSGGGALTLFNSGSTGAFRGTPGPQFSGTNSGYTGALLVTGDLRIGSGSGNPPGLWPQGGVTILNSGALFTGASSVRVAVGGILSFGFGVTDSNLSNVTTGIRGGIGATGASGSLASLTNVMSHVGKGGMILIDNQDSLNNDRISDSAGFAMDNIRLHIVGRNAASSQVTESIGALSLSGGNLISLDRPNGTSSGVRPTFSSMAEPTAGNSLLLQTANWGTAASENQMIVSGSKPTVTNGMISPGVQHFDSHNSLGSFVTFSGNDLLIATSTSTDITTAGATDIVNIGTSAQTLNEAKTVHAVRIGQNLNLGGFTLTVGSGGYITSSNTASNGTLDFGSNPAFIGAYNSAGQSNISANISGSGGLTILGTSQTLNLSGTNTGLSGGLFINGGAVRMTTAAANGNNVTVNTFGRLVAGGTINSTDTIGGLSGTGFVSAWFASAGTTTGTLNIAPASGTHTFDGSFTNGVTSGRVLAIQKSGDGTQIISRNATASHTGALAVNAGTLLLDADFSSASGLATVGPTGTFGGSGTLGGDMTVNDGGALAFVINSAPGSHDKLDVAGGLTFDGSTVTITITSPGGITSGSYTLATAADGITGTPVFNCNMPSGWTGSATVSGPNVVLTVSPSGADPYDDWAGETFALPFTNTAPDVDFDNDGLDNLLEFVLGSDPTISQPGVAPAVTSATGSDLVITFQRSDESELQPVTVKVQISDDLGTWNPANDVAIADEDGSGPNGVTYTVAENDGDPDTITVTIPKGAAPKKFARVIASE